MELFYQFYTENLLTDVIIKLVGLDDQSMTLHLHKLILCAHCPYFGKLLMNNTFQEAQARRELVLKVPHLSVSYDIIMSFYGQDTNIANLPQCEHLLQKLICQDYWGLSCDISLLEEEHRENVNFYVFLHHYGNNSRMKY